MGMRRVSKLVKGINCAPSTYSITESCMEESRQSLFKIVPARTISGSAIWG